MMKDEKKPRKLRVMVSSAVYGYQEFLDRIYDVLTNLGYEVWMSHKGTIPVVSDNDSIANCLQAVDGCDLFLGIITTQYGTTKRDQKSATHLEFERAIERNKLRWFLVDDKVVFARRLLGHFYSDAGLKKKVNFRNFHFKPHTSFSDLRLLDMYDVAANQQRNSAGEVNAVDWVQEYSEADAALLFTMSQFSRYHDLEHLLITRLGDKNYVSNRLS